MLILQPRKIMFFIGKSIGRSIMISSTAHFRFVGNDKEFFSTK